MRSGWPVVLEMGAVRLRPLRRGDGREWNALRLANLPWLSEWEASSPEYDTERHVSFGAMVSYLRSEGRAGRMLPFAVTYDGALVGQLTVSNIVYGSFRSATVGYWVAQSHAGRGIIPVGVALATDHCFTAMRLHRMEINIRPENVRSLRVVEKLGFRDEGLRERLLHINGQWRDHRSFALTADEVPAGVLARWHSRGTMPR